MPITGHKVVKYAKRRAITMSKPRKGSSARNVIKIGSGRKQRKKSKVLLKNIANNFNHGNLGLPDEPWVDY